MKTGGSESETTANIMAVFVWILVGLPSKTFLVHIPFYPYDLDTNT